MSEFTNCLGATSPPRECRPQLPRAVAVITKTARAARRRHVCVLLSHAYVQLCTHTQSGGRWVQEIREYRLISSSPPNTASSQPQSVCLQELVSATVKPFEAQTQTHRHSSRICSVFLLLQKRESFVIMKLQSEEVETQTQSWRVFNCSCFQTSNMISLFETSGCSSSVSSCWLITSDDGVQSHLMLNVQSGAEGPNNPSPSSFYSLCAALGQRAAFNSRCREDRPLFWIVGFHNCQAAKHQPPQP